MKKDHGAGVADLIDRMLANDLSDLKTLSRHRIPIGVPVNGPPQSGIAPPEPGQHRGGIGQEPADPETRSRHRSGRAGSHGVRHVRQREINAHDRRSWNASPMRATRCSSSTRRATTRTSSSRNTSATRNSAPQMEDVTDALRDPKRSVVVNLLGVPLADRPKYFAQLLPRILEVKARTGRPHWLVVDEAHHLLPVGPDAAGVSAQLPDRGTMYITVHAGAVEPGGARPRRQVARHRRSPGEDGPRILHRRGCAQARVPRRAGRQGPDR